jgi:hypothetical protein
MLARSPAQARICLEADVLPSIRQVEHAAWTGGFVFA